MKKTPRLTVGALIFNYKRELLLMKSPKWYDRYVVPGGHVDFQEKLTETVIREVYEETNLNVNNVRFLCVLEFINSKEFFLKNKHFVGIQFTCKTKETDVKLNYEATSYIWVLPKDAVKLKNIESRTKRAIEIYLIKNQA